MKLIPRGRLLVQNVRAAFPFQTQPATSIPDFLTNMSVGVAQDLQNIRVDPNAGSVYTRPIFVPSNQTISSAAILGERGIRDNDGTQLGTGLPTLEWTQWNITGVSSAVWVQMFQHEFGFQEPDFQWDGETGSPENLHLEAHAALNTQGFVAFISKTIWKEITSSADTYWEVRWTVGTGHYRVVAGLAAQARVDVSTDGTNWKFARWLVVADGPIETFGNSQPGTGRGTTTLSVLLMNGKLQIALGGSASPFVLPLTAGTLTGNPVITQVRVLAKYWTQFGFSVHPQKWTLAGGLRSAPVALGFPPTTVPYYVIHGLNTAVTRASGAPWTPTFPLGSQITVTRVTNPTDANQVYDLAIQNAVAGTYAGQNYADFTASATRVTVKVDGTWEACALYGLPGCPHPRRVVPKSEVIERSSFDLQELTVRQNLEFLMDNLKGQFAGLTGNIAVSLALGYFQPFTELFQRFVGFSHTRHFLRPAANRSVVRFVADDRMQQLEERLIAAPPDMDGWNHYYAIAWLAQYGGITLSQMRFVNLVPSDPYTYTGYDTAPYFLPFGTGMNPWTPRNRTVSVLELMRYVRSTSTFLLYFDAFGFLRYEPWVPNVVTPTKKIFSNNPAHWGADGEKVAEFWDFSFRSTTKDVRNQVLLVGIDQFSDDWSVLISKREDTASIRAPAGLEPINYIGWEKPFVWVDSRFANATFTSAAANRLMALLRQPGLEVTFTTWMQPHLYPMDVVFVDEPSTGIYGIPFFITDMETRWIIAGGGRQEVYSTITARYIEPEVVGILPALL